MSSCVVSVRKKWIPWKICLLLFVLPLSACQRDLQMQNDEHVKQAHQKEAAAYNTELGLAYLKQGDSPRAKRKMLTAIQLAPQSPEVNAAMGYFLEKTGDLKEAEVFYKKALHLAPSSGETLNNYGTFLCRQGQYKEAEAYFLKAVKDPLYIQSAGAYENAGLCAAAIPDNPQAIVYFTRALEQDNERKQSLAELATLELKLQHPQQALAVLQKYEKQTSEEPLLMALALDAAHQSGQTAVEQFYKERLSQFNYAGETNDNNSAIG